MTGVDYIRAGGPALKTYNEKMMHQSGKGQSSRERKMAEVGVNSDGGGEPGAKDKERTHHARG